MVKIPEVELAFSNACTASCFICSRTHGGSNDPFMSWETFQRAKEQLHNVDFRILQTGGDGDSFLNPIYIDALRELRAEFPKIQIVLYSNFALLTPDIADTLIDENLINNLYTRIDSLNPIIFRAATRLDMDTVFRNIDYFIENNNNIKFQINYSNIKSYRERCREVLGKEPFYWNNILEGAPFNEHWDIVNRFKHKNVKFEDIKRSLWAERNDPAIRPEPDLPCWRTYCFNSVCYVWTDGDVGICGYDDGQDAMIVGNIHESTIAEIWESDRRRQMVEHVTNRGIKEYPCINPKACLFY